MEKLSVCEKYASSRTNFTLHERDIRHVLSSANLSLKGCVNPASWLPLAAGTSFKQPLVETFAH